MKNFWYLPKADNMAKVKYLLLFILLIGLTAPLAANAWCCRTIYKVGTPPVIEFIPRVFEVNTDEQCLETCKGQLFGCQNYFIKDATADVSNLSCVSSTSGCCQVTVKGLIADTHLSYPANSQNPECNFYCSGITFCESVYKIGQFPNMESGFCETDKSKIPTPETRGCCRTKTLGLGQLGSSSYSYKCQENIPQKDCLADFQEFVAGGTVKAGNPCQCVAAATGGKKTGAPGQVVSEVKFDYGNVINPLKETNLSVVVGRVIRAILSIIGSIFLIMVIYGGFIWMTAMGNDAKVKQGRNILMWAVIGIIVIFLSWMLVAVVFEALGVR